MGGKDGDRKISLVNWDMVCKGKSTGRFGLLSAFLTNKAYMLKLGWWMLYEPNSLWIRVLKCKYMNGRDVIFSNSKKLNLSPTWKVIVDTHPLLLRNMEWSMGNATSVRFWHDTWLKDVGPLLHHHLNPSFNANLDAKVVYFTINGNWDWNILRPFVQDWICALLRDLPPPVHNAGNDSLYWIVEPSGKFQSLMLCYVSLMQLIMCRMIMVRFGSLFGIGKALLGRDYGYGLRFMVNSSPMLNV